MIILRTIPFELWFINFEFTNDISLSYLFDEDSLEGCLQTEILQWFFVYAEGHD